MNKLTVMFLLLFVSNIYAEDKINIIVFDLQPKGAVIKATAIGASYYLRKYIDGNSRFKINRNNNKNCYRRTCAVSVGKKLHADKAVIGYIKRRYRVTHIHLKLININKGAVEFSSTIKFKPKRIINKSIKTIVDRIFYNITNRVKSPSDLKTTIGKTNILLNWQAKKDSRYYVYKSNDNNKFYKIAETGKGVYKDKNTKPGKKYFYKVQSANDDGYSLLSNSVVGIRAVTTIGYYVRSLIPGYGQIYYGNNSKGYMFLGGFFASCIFTGASYWYYKNKKDAYSNYNGYSTYPGDTRYLEELDKRYDKYKLASNLLLFTSIVTGVVYIAHWVDVLYWNEPYYLRKTNSMRSSLLFNFNRYIAINNNPMTEISIGLRF